MKKEPLFIAFASQKEGVGKSVFTVLAASILHYSRGYRVGVVDCDGPQHSIYKMCERNIENVQNNDFLKVAIYRQHEQIQKLAYPMIRSNPEKAEFDIVLFDLPGTLRSQGGIYTIASMNHIFVPLKADSIVMQSSLQFAGVIEEEPVSRHNCNLNGVHLFWYMIDHRERKKTYQAWTRVIREANLRLPDNREKQNSGMVELLDEICRVTHLESPATL